MKIFGRISIAILAASAMFTSCVTFDPEPVLAAGEAVFAVKVMTTFGDDVTANSTVTVTSDNLGDNILVYSNGTARLTGNEKGNKTVNNQTLTFKAVYKGYEGVKDYTVNKILPGSVLNATITFVLGPDPAGYYVKLEKTYPATSEYSYLAKATYEYYDAALGRKVLLMENATEYKFSRTEKVTFYTGTDVENYATLTPEIVKTKALPFYNKVITEEKTQKLVISAWSVYGLERDIQTYIETYGVYKEGLDERVGGFDVKNYATYSNYLEYAHPSHAKHYTHGHGTHIGHAHGQVHGSADNAGGGIIDAL